MADETIVPDDPDTVWANTWNPPTDEWSPTAEPHNTWGVAQPGHGDLSMANPMSDDQGNPRTTPPESGGSIPDVRDNLLTDVQKRMQTTPPAVEVHHVVENVERGAESVNVRQITVVGNQQITQLLEANPRRRRALVRVVPTTPGLAGMGSPAGTFSIAPPPLTITVPAGQTWALLNISFHYVAGVTVTNRFVSVLIKDASGRTIYQMVDPTALTASQDATVSVAPGNTLAHTSAGGTSFNVSMNLPAGIVLTAGATIVLSAVGVDPTDSINNAVPFFTTTGSAVFVAARTQPGSASAPQTWFKLISGDAPLEVKSQDGIDAIAVNATDSIAVQVYEELVGARPDSPGIGI